MKQNVSEKEGNWRFCKNMSTEQDIVSDAPFKA